MSNKILCVDDDPNVLEGYQRNLRKQFALETAAGATEALEAIQQRGPYAVIVADMQMPVMDGVELLTQVRKISPNTVRLMLTGNADQKTAVDAVNKGNVFRFLTKPCPADQLAVALHAALRQFEMLALEKDLMERTLNGVIRTFMEILSNVDPKSFGQMEKWRDHVHRLGEAVGIEKLWEVEAAAMVSRIGLLTLPPQVLLKLRANIALTAGEQAQLDRVPEISEKLLGNIPRLEEVTRIVAYHQKRFDGAGLPRDGVAGQAIPAGARVLKLVHDMMDLHNRGLDTTLVFEQLRSRIGYYDPVILETATRCFSRSANAADDAPENSLSIELKDLHVGDTLTANVEARDGSLLLLAGTVVTDSAWKRLLNRVEIFGIREPLYILKEFRRPTWDPGLQP